MPGRWEIKTMTIRNLLKAMYQSSPYHCGMNDGNEILVYWDHGGHDEFAAEIETDPEKYDFSTGMYKGYTVTTYSAIPAREILKAQIAGIEFHRDQVKIFIK